MCIELVFRSMSEPADVAGIRRWLMKQTTEAADSSARTKLMQNLPNGKLAKAANKVPHAATPPAGGLSIFVREAESSSVDAARSTVLVLV